MCYEVSSRRPPTDTGLEEAVEALTREVGRWVEEILSTTDIPLVVCGCGADEPTQQVKKLASYFQGN